MRDHLDRRGTVRQLVAVDGQRPLAMEWAEAFANLDNDLVHPLRRPLKFWSFY